MVLQTSISCDVKKAASHRDSSHILPGPKDPIHFADIAERLCDNGYAAIPVFPGTKKSFIRNRSQYGKKLPSPMVLAKWMTAYPDHGTAVVCGSCVAIDIDATNLDHVARLKAIAIGELGDGPLEVVGQFPKLKLIYRTVSPIHTSHLPGVDILGDGSYFVAFGNHPLTGQPYTWQGDSPLNRPLASLPPVTGSQVEKLRSIYACLAGGLTLQATLRSTPAVIPANPGLVIDNRDTLLRDIVHRIWAAGGRHAEEIADKAFAEFAEAADLTRPKRNGKLAWSRADALKKAKYLLLRGKTRPSVKSSLHNVAQDDLRRQFKVAVQQIGAYGRLSPTAVMTSEVMLSLANGPDGCFATPATIAAKIDRAIDPVKRARRQLVKFGLWSIEGPGGGRGHRAHYFPNLLDAAAIAKKVTEMDTRNSSEEGKGLEEELPNLEKNQNIYSVFKSLAGWTRETSK
jgi:hypothetical protein